MSAAAVVRANDLIDAIALIGAMRIPSRVFVMTLPGEPDFAPLEGNGQKD
jgi:hypothetical protein